MSTTLPKAVADYLETPAGQYMTQGASYFVWWISQRKISVSGNSRPNGPTAPDTIRFARDGSGWRRID